MTSWRAIFPIPILLLGLSSANAGTPPPHSQCQSYSTALLGKEVEYCIQRSHPEAPIHPGEAVVYYLHGLGGNAGSWESDGYADELAALAGSEGFPPVTVVSFDTSATSFFSDAGDLPTGVAAYETWLTTDLMPWVEAHHGVCAKRECRALLGISMGGFGALKIALRHPDRFSLAVASSPALPPFNAFAGDDQWKSYFDRHPVGSAIGMQLLGIVRGILAGPEVADRNDPSWLVENVDFRGAFPTLDFDMGDQDYYGFQEGYQRFKDALDHEKAPYTSVLVPGAGHDLFQSRRAEHLRFVRDHLTFGP